MMTQNGVFLLVPDHEATFSQICETPSRAKRRGWLTFRKSAISHVPNGTRAETCVSHFQLRFSEGLKIRDFFFSLLLLISTILERKKNLDRTCVSSARIRQSGVFRDK